MALFFRTSGSISPDCRIFHAVIYINQIIRETSTKKCPTRIVLSSSWRVEFPFGDGVERSALNMFFEAVGFIFEYLKRQGHPDLEFGNHSQKGWDIKYPFGLASNGVVLVQVKTVSAFSKTKTISPIHLAPDYCELYLVSLNEDLIPDNIWKPRGFNPAKKKFQDGEEVVIGTRMPKNADDAASGFTKLENIFEDFKQAFPELY